ncbi:MAG: hypothetical protein AAGH41_11540 [Pseudomonadota bacterium]
MRYATFLSALLHLGAVFSALIVAPFLADPEPPLVVQAIPIQLLSEAEIRSETSVMADRKADAVDEDIRPIAPDDGIEEVALPDPEPMQIPPEPERDLERDPEVLEPEPPQPEPPQQKPQTPEPDRIDDLSSLDEVLKDLEDDPEAGAPQEVLDPEGLRNNERVGLGDKLTATETDLVRARMVDCYDQLAGVPDAENLVVIVKLDLDRDGEIIGSPDVENDLAINISGNPYWKATRDRAVRAAIKCAPYDYLPQEKYSQWDEMILRFTPLGVM